MHTAQIIQQNPEIDRELRRLIEEIKKHAPKSHTNDIIEAIKLELDKAKVR